MQMQTIKKVASGAIGLFLTGATLMGPAMAVADLSDFQNMGPSDTVIVVGASAATADVVGGINIGGKLAQSGIESATCSVTCADGGTAQVAGGVKIETSSKKLRFNDAAKHNNLYAVKGALSSKDLDLLERGTVTYDDGTTVTYTQILTLSSGAQIHFDDRDTTEGTDVETPRVLLGQPKTSNLYEYRLTCASGIDTRDADDVDAAPGFDGRDLTIMGKVFTVGMANDDVRHDKLVLYGGGEEKTLIAAGDSVAFELAGETHAIRMTSWTGSGSDMKGVFEIDGVSYTKGEDSTITIDPTTNSQITIKTLSDTKVPSVAGGAATEGASATIFIGSAKVIVEHDKEVKVGEDSIDGSLATFTNTTDGKITSIVVSYKPENDALVADVGQRFVDPVFGAVEYAFTGYTESDIDARDLVRVRSSTSTKLALSFTNNGGDNYEIDLAKYSSGWTLGGSDELLVTQHPTVHKGERFFLSDSENSYVMEFTAIDDDDMVITIENVASDEETSIVYNSTGGARFYVGATEYVLENVDHTSSPESFDVVDADLGTAGTVGNVKMHTYYGHVFDVTNVPEVFIEERDDISDSDRILMRVSVTTESEEIKTVDLAKNGTVSGTAALGSFYSITDTSDVDHAMTTYGTLVVDDTDGDDIKVYLPDNQVTYDVYLMKAGVSPPTSTSTGTEVSQTVEVEAPSLGNGIAKLDSGVTSVDKEEKNLILVGGPYANKLVEDLASAGKTPDPAYWDSNLRGKFILQAVEDAFAEGRTAIVVAGSSAADTQEASLKLATEDVSGAAISCMGTTCSDFVYPAEEAEEEEETPAEE